MATARGRDICPGLLPYLVCLCRALFDDQRSYHAGLSVAGDIAVELVFACRRIDHDFFLSARIDIDIDFELVNREVVWRGAFVPLAALPSAERRWVTLQARRALEALRGAPLSDRIRVELTEEVASEKAAAVLAALLEAVQGCLLFGEGTRGLGARKGDAVA